jgi:superfamily II DNA or RNA helicase
VIKLTIGNSECQILGLSDKEFKQLRELMSYKIDAQAMHFAGAHRNPVRYLIDKRGVFPTGLLYVLEKWAKKGRVIIEKKDTRIEPKALESSISASMPHTPYPEQIEAVKAAVLRKRGIISAVTGSGKSLIAALIVDALKLRTLIVVPSLELKKQLTTDLLKTFGPIVGGPGKAIWVANVDSLDPKQPVEGYDCVIIDEFHHSGAKTYRELNRRAWKNIYWRFGMTATPFRSNENERLLLESVLAEVIYRLSYHTAVERSYIVPVEAYYVELPTIPVKATTWAGVYKELVTDRQDRNAIIANLIGCLYYSGCPTLTLTKEIAHGESIQALVEPIVDFCKGENDDNRVKILEFCLGEIYSLIATTGVCGEGIDLKPAEYVIVAGLGKSKNQFMQQIGRVLRKSSCKESGKVVIIKDSSHKWTLNHFNAQVKILRDEYGVEPVKLG